MISFRYHAMSLVAVLLALAAGVVLGSGPLQAQEDPAAQDGSALAAARGRVASLDAAVQYDDAYASATAPQLLDGVLDGRAVTLVTLPGADPGTVGTLADLVDRAGGAVTARVSVGRKLLDVANRQLVTELAAQMQESAREAGRVPADASGYTRLGALVAHAVLTADDGGEPVDDAGDAVLAAGSTADLLTTRGSVSRRGSLALVVAGDPYGGADERKGAGSILASLLAAFDAGSDGVVLAGPGTAGAEDGLVGAVRGTVDAAHAVSTVDVADRVPGDVAAVLALAEQAAGGSGQYGSDAAGDGPLPQAAGR